MNKRQVKKQARNLLTGRPVRGIRFHGNTGLNEEGTLRVTGYIPANARFCRAIIEYTGDSSSLELPFFIKMKMSGKMSDKL